MQLIIDIPEEIYQEAIESGYSHMYDEAVANAVAEGIPIPKGHGRLIDERQITEWKQVGLVINDGAVTRCLVPDAPTIIEADKED